MIKRFFNSAFWLLEKYPVNCPREFFSCWLLCCICKNEETQTVAKKQFIKNILSFLELPKRAEFENRLCEFILSYHLKTNKREGFVSQEKISGQVDWARTINENMIANPGALTRFIARPLHRDFDHDVLLVLKNIAWELKKNLEYFSKLLNTSEYDNRIKNLESCSSESTGFCRTYDEHIAWKLRQTPAGRELATEIAKWHFYCSINLCENIDNRQFEKLEQIIERADAAQKDVNKNDLLEGISIIQSAQALSELGFNIVHCDLATSKPCLTLKRNNQQVKIAKNIDGFSKNDRTKDYRTVSNKPSGLQPDIIYQCSFGNEKLFYLLGDAKNYEKSDFGPALYAMLHYLLAFSKELNLPEDFFNPDKCETFLKVTDNYKRIVLFFPEDKKSQIADNHPIQLVFGQDLGALKNFFEKAFYELDNSASASSDMV